ncbi:hypothetical protein [Bacillus paranthracis]|uniref:hypothetical protein n=2 Tax=Bacillaceae TaxID=186817 RepID=UPI00128B91AB
MSQKENNQTEMQNQWVAAFSDETSKKELTDEQKEWGLAFGTIKPEKTEEQNRWQRAMDGERERTEQEQNWIDAFKNY